MLVRATFYWLRIQDHHICFFGSKGFIVIKGNISIWTQKTKILKKKITRWYLEISYLKKVKKNIQPTKYGLPVRFMVKKIFWFAKYNLLNDTKNNKKKTNMTVKGDILKFLFLKLRNTSSKAGSMFLKISSIWA